mgnify:CR=1 FL=1
MDDNKTPAATQTPEVVQPTQNVVPPPKPAVQSEGNNKMMMWLVGGLVLVILVVGVIYLFLNSQQQKSQAPEPTPKAAVEENLEQELDAVNIEDVEGEFKSVDSDLQKL